MRSGRCWPPAGSPCPESPASGCGPWPTCSPTRPPAASPCAWTAPKCRSGARARESPGRRAFVSGKKKQNTEKATVVTDEKGRTLWAGRVPPWADARPDRGADRGHRRPVHGGIPQVKSQSRRRVPGPGQGVPGPGPGPAAEAEEGRHPGGNRRLRGRTAQAVIGTDLRRARQRRAQAMARPSSATSDDERTSTRPSWRSPGWSPTAPPSGNPASQPARPARPTANRAPRR